MTAQFAELDAHNLEELKGKLAELEAKLEEIKAELR